MADEEDLVTVLGAQDGSDNVIIQFPPKLMAEVGWEVGDILSFEVVGQAIILRRIAEGQPSALKGDPEAVVCNVCDELAGGLNPRVPIGSLQSNSELNNRMYKLNLCEGCFVHALSTLRRDRMIRMMFEGAHEERDSCLTDVFGVVSHSSSLRQAK